MARGKKSNVFFDLVVVFSCIPWFISLPLAVVGYFVLSHYVGVMAIEKEMAISAPSAGVNPTLAVVKPGLIHLALTAAMYVLPLLLVISAAVNVFRSRNKERLLEKASSKEAINSMSWRDFEVLVREYFEREGYKTIDTGAGPDGGVDVRLSKDGKRYLVQCKRWRSVRVSVKVVRELYGVMAAESADGIFIVTSGVYTKDAESFAKGKPIELIDGAGLYRMIQKARRAEATQMQDKNIKGEGDEGATGSHSGPAVMDNSKSEMKIDVQHSVAPACPKCGDDMVERSAKRGKNVGQPFWGCKKYPSCRGVIYK
jgi:restriction system protein